MTARLPKVIVLSLKFLVVLLLDVGRCLRKAL